MLSAGELLLLCLGAFHNDVEHCICNLVILDCAAGKSRTGVVSAILLHKSGMSREYIIADFMKTASNPEAYLAQFAGERPGIRLDVITPHERYMEELLAWLTAQEI